MKTKFSTGVFTAWATMFLMVLIVDSSAAWYEWTQEAKDKLEWEDRTIKCVIEKKVTVSDETDIDFTFVGVLVTDHNEYENTTEPGTKTICVNGKKYPDCSDILGFWQSWDGEGECVPAETEAQ